MYFIEKDIKFVNGIDEINYGFHFISRYEIDFINNKTEIQISSSESMEIWRNSNYSSPYVNFYELDGTPRFDEDPINYILKQLVIKKGTVFYRSEISKDYSIERIIRSI